MIEFLCVCSKSFSCVCTHDLRLFSGTVRRSHALSARATTRCSTAYKVGDAGVGQQTHTQSEYSGEKSNNDIPN